MPFSTLVNAILKEIKGNRIKDKLKLSIDLALVASCLRTAYLVDAFTPSDHVSFWQGLLHQLRSNPISSFAFASVIHIFEPGTKQSFIVNISMIPKLNLGDFESPERNEYPVFVQISCHQTFQLLDAPPSLLQLIDSLNHSLSSCSMSAPGVSPTLTHMLPQIPPSLSVPLAAILLDYSVAYVPDSEFVSGSASNSFSGVLMNFFECVLSFREAEASLNSKLSQQINLDVKACTVMKFSCPVTQDNALQPQKIISHLDHLFSQRLESIGDPTLLKVEIYQTTQRLDQLAF